MENQILTNLLLSKKGIHFIGIGGISMSALAELLYIKGYKVTGSDLQKNSSTMRLENIGIPVINGHSPENVKNAEIVIFTAAVKADNCELIEAKRLGIPVFERSILLGSLMENYPSPIAIAGTHGKTTTTSMVTQILLEAGVDPTCLIGGQLSSIGGNFRVGKSEYLVCEACEYVDSFLTLRPKISVILNIEEDHLDYFKDLNQIKNSFLRFANLSGEDGLCILCADSKNACDILPSIKCKTVTYGIENEKSNILATNITKSAEGFPVFDLYLNGSFLFNVSLSVPGTHNILNSLAAICCALTLNIDVSYIKNGLFSFHGTKRRFERLGFLNGALLVDDYAHHPTEIKATLSAAKSLNFKRVITVFQPHTYTRTIALFDDFLKALAPSDLTIFAEIYPAREKNLTNLSSKAMQEKLPGSYFFKSFEELAAFIKKEAREGDLVIAMGAGDIYKALNIALE